MCLGLCVCCVARLIPWVHALENGCPTRPEANSEVFNEMNEDVVARIFSFFFFFFFSSPLLVRFYLRPFIQGHVAQ